VDVADAEGVTFGSGAGDETFSVVGGSLVVVAAFGAADAVAVEGVRAARPALGVKPRSRCSILAAAAALPRSRLAGCGVFGAVVFATGFSSGFVGVALDFDCIAATDLLMALTVSEVAFATRAFSAALPEDFTTTAGFSVFGCFPSFVSCCRLELFFSAASLALLAFFSLRNLTSGVNSPFS
jgi:hypothetical protein